MEQFINLSDQLAYRFFQNKQYELAYRQAEITLSMNKLNKEIRFNAAKCAYYANRYDKAIEHMNVCLLLDPEGESYKRELALYLPWVGRRNDSLKIIKELPMDDRTMFNLGWYNLNNGNFLEGMKCLEKGRNINCWGTRNIDMPTPEWNGESLTGKKIFIITEGGIGDEIIFARFLYNLKEMGAKVFVKSSETIKPIFDRMPCVSYTTTKSMYPEHDYWVPSMSLPVKMELHKVSGEPYLEPNPEYVDKWKSKLTLGDFNIGIRWEGGQLFEHDQRRTLPIEDLAKKIDGMGTLFSLQKETVTTRTPPNIKDLELNDIEDTLAIISLMDIIVTSCTVTAHLAGAIGKKTFVIVPIVSYFTWTGDGRSSDWYNSVEVFRQTNPLNWDEPIEECVKKIKEIRIV